MIQTFFKRIQREIEITLEIDISQEDNDTKRLRKHMGGAIGKRCKFRRIAKTESEEMFMIQTIYQPSYWYYFKGDFLNRVHPVRLRKAVRMPSRVEAGH